MIKNSIKKVLILGIDAIEYDLVEKWGFNRVYNDYEQFERLGKINQIKQK